MKKRLLFPIGLILFIQFSCLVNDEPESYTSYSRLTNPCKYSYILDKLPEDVIGICKIAEQQTVHRNLLTYFDIPANKWEEMNNIWLHGEPIPDLSVMLTALQKTEPNTLYAPRPVERRLIGACMTESIFLSGLLRYKNIPARIRAGYFKDTMANANHVISFWENNVKGRGIEEDLLKQNPPEWKKMRTSLKFNPDQYAEYPHDGRTHIRSQLLLDFYCLLNHDMAGFENQAGPISDFVKRRRFETVSKEELSELDALADLISREPSIKDLIEFYHSSKTLQIKSAELDPYSYVFKN